MRDTQIAGIIIARRAKLAAVTAEISAWESVSVGMTVREKVEKEA